MIPRWTIVVPVFNENAFLASTLRTLAEQTRPFRLIVVDNGSTDGSLALAARMIAELGIDGRILTEPRPGPVPALSRGLAEVTTEFVATCDADTFYPSSYLETAEALLDRSFEAVIACAYYLPPEAGRLKRFLAAAHQLGAAILLPRQAHNGGAGQCFRTAALNACGGYDDRTWPFVLGDHEIVHRVFKHGSAAWRRDHWCVPSPRRKNGDAVRWSLLERLLYHATPFAFKDWYFYDFLAPRLARRGLHCTRLRQRTWIEASDEASDALCG